MPGVPPDAFAQVKKAFKGLMSRKKHKGPESSSAQPPPSSATQRTTSAAVPAAPSGAAIPSTSAAAPVAAEAPQLVGSNNVTESTTSHEPAKVTSVDTQISEPVKVASAGTVEPHPTGKPAPGISATSGPLDDNPASGYVDMVDSSKTGGTSFTENETAEDLPFATPMEMPEAAKSGKLTAASTTEGGLKTA